MKTLTDGKIRFHITHNYTSLNKGWAAIVLSTTAAIRRFLPNSEFTIESYNPEIDKEIYGPFGIRVISIIVSSKSSAVILLIKIMLWRLVSKLFNTNHLVERGKLATYYESDVILDLAGDTLCVPFKSHGMVFNLKRTVLAMLGHAYHFLLFILLKKPVVICAQTIGPIGPAEFLIKRLLNKMSLITVREENSLRYLAKIGVTKPPVFLTADPAFLLPKLPTEEVNRILKSENVDTQDPVMGICASSETATYHFKNGAREFAELFAKIVDSIVIKYGTHVILIPFSTWKGHGGDDRAISREIFGFAKEKQKVTLIKGDYDPIALKGIINRCSLFIGSRGHSCILALSSGVPTIAIAHNPKFLGIMNMFHQQEYICRTEELSFDQLTSQVCRLWDNQETVRKELETSIRTVQHLSALNAELVRDVVVNCHVQTITPTSS
jgi:polysaccharide pyruvyl transferase WcaK-like protein